MKDATNTVWWFSKTEHPEADNRRVLVPYSESMKSLIKNGYKAKKRPSGHDISDKFGKDNGGAIPSNLLTIANTESNSAYLRLCREFGIKAHPARYPAKLVEFFVNYLLDPDYESLILDPFGGSNVTGSVAEERERERERPPMALVRAGGRVHAGVDAPLPGGSVVHRSSHPLRNHWRLRTARMR